MPDRGFRRLSFSASGVADTRDQQALDAYLRGANISFTHLDPGVPLRAELIQFSQMTIAHVLLPPAVVEWPRDHASLERAVAILVYQGRVEVDAATAIFRREPRLFLVPPGTGRVRFRTADPMNELVYISFAAPLIADLPEPSPSGGRPLQGQVLAPLYAFARSASTLAMDDEDVFALQATAEEVVRSVARIAARGQVPDAPLFAQAMEMIAREYGDPNLSVAMIAGRLRVADRTLQAVFAKESTTVSRELRDVRVEAALKLRRAGEGLRNREIASMSGFGSESAMFRALRRHASETAAASRVPPRVG